MFNIVLYPEMFNIGLGFYRNHKAIRLAKLISRMSQITRLHPINPVFNQERVIRLKLCSHYAKMHVLSDQNTSWFGNKMQSLRFGTEFKRDVWSICMRT